ncbi:hypothetical protein KJ840_00900 [Patescibacteria group bacterium]|nr:hypothetical protein [Patescibacteria group bacterium]
MDNKQEKYKFEIIKTSQDESVYFGNLSDKFVEVVITADGKDIKTGKKITAQTKGYCYPQGYSKAIKTKLSKGIKVVAYVYEGVGREKPVDFNRPAILRKGEPQKAYFKRTSVESVATFNEIV